MRSRLMEREKATKRGDIKNSLPSRIEESYPPSFLYVRCKNIPNERRIKEADWKK